MIGIDQDQNCLSEYPHIPKIISDLHTALKKLPNTSCDIVFMKSLIEHLRDPKKCWNKCIEYCVLKGH